MGASLGESLAAGLAAGAVAWSRESSGLRDCKLLLGEHAARTGGAGWPAQKMKGKSARIIVTMGMPGFAYGTMFGGHSVKALEKGILRISGFRPVRRTILGGVEAAGVPGRAKMLHKVEALGRRGV